MSNFSPSHRGRPSRVNTHLILVNRQLILSNPQNAIINGIAKMQGIPDRIFLCSYILFQRYL